ncbi:MAG: thiamine-phosphate kinase [Elusimicrobia bacterium]|nr:thiamine-phosphate kinase [Elusimicrobiota bacterium]
MERLAGLGEDGLLALIFKRFARQRRPGLLLGPGDDAAVLRLAPGRVLVATQDDLAEDTHFELRWADFRRLGHKLFRINLSDLAAMGDVEPIGVVVSAGFPPDAPRRWATDFLQGLSDDVRSFGTPVIGGNLTRSSKVFFSMTALGAARPGRILRRSGAKAGDILAGVGPLGAAAEGLKLLKKGAAKAGGRASRPPSGRASAGRDAAGGPYVRAFYEPAPQREAAAVLAGKRLATSLIDNSDGLARCAALLAEASGLGAAVDLADAPVDGDPDAGEDYGLVFTVPPGRWPALRAALPLAYRLGRMVPKAKGTGAAGGYDHFKGR